MIKVRKSVFETNSSSAHTLVLTNNETWVSKNEINEFKNSLEAVEKKWLVWNKDHTGYYLTIVGDGFGREFRLLTLWHAKLQYIAASLGIDECAKLVEVLREYLGNDCLGILLTSEPSDYGDSDTLCPSVDNYGLNECMGSIDHQSIGRINNAMKLIDEDIKEAIKKIIFNNKYVIVVDSDETGTFDELLESGFMEGTYFTHILHEYYVRDEDGNYNWSHPAVEFKPIEDYLKEESGEE